MSMMVDYIGICVLFCLIFFLKGFYFFGISELSYRCIYFSFCYLYIYEEYI